MFASDDPFLTMNRVVVLGWKSDWFVGKFAQLEGGFPPLEDRGKTT